MPVTLYDIFAPSNIARAQSDPAYARDLFSRSAISNLVGTRPLMANPDTLVAYYYNLPVSSPLRVVGQAAGVTAELLRALLVSYLASLPVPSGGILSDLGDTLKGIASTPGGLIWLAAVGGAWAGSLLAPEAAAPAAGAGAAAAGSAATATEAATAATAAAAGGAAASSAAATTAAAVTTDTVLGSVLGIVKDVQNVLGPIVNTVADAVKSVRDVVTAINDGILKPIIGPLQDTYKTVTALVDTIHRDWQAGLAGILRIPQDIANAFTSLDGTMQRAVAMLNAGSAENLAKVLLPGLAAAGAGPIGTLTETLGATLAGKPGTWRGPPLVTLGENPDLEAYKAYARTSQEQLEGDDSLPATFFKWLFRAVGTLEGLAAQRAPYVELWKEEVMRAAGILRFDANTTLMLSGRGIISQAQAVDELRALGYSSERATALLETVRRIPQDTQGLDWWYRGLIDDASLRRILSDNQWSQADQDKVIEASKRLLQPADIIATWQRSLIDDLTLYKLMAQQGYQVETVDALKELASTPRGVDATIALMQRAALLTASGLISVSEAQAPPEVTRAGFNTGQSLEAINAQWLNHWNILSPALACAAYFRGWFTESQLEQALDAWAIPRAMQRNYIDLQRPLIPARSITTLMSQGIISQADAMDILRGRGFSDVDANRLVQLERGSSAAPTTAAADEFHGLTQSTIMALYTAGTIGRADAQSLLEHIGMGAQAAESTLQLTDIREAATARQAQIDLAIAQATSGAITRDDVVGLLGSIGATDTETNKALAKIASAAKAGTKLPSEADALAMYRYGILAREDTAQLLTRLGYSAGWAELIVQLGEKRGSQPVQSG